MFTHVYTRHTSLRPTEMGVSRKDFFPAFLAEAGADCSRKQKSSMRDN